MDFLKRIFGTGGDDKRRVLLVDLAAVIAGNGADRTAPRVVIDTLEQLGRFARRENLEIVVLVDRGPLRKIPDGSEFQGLRVYYTGQDQSVSAEVRRRAGIIGGRRVVVVTADNRLAESLNGEGLMTLRGSTLQRALNGDEGRKDSRRRSPRRRRSGGRSRNKAPRNDNGNGKGDEGGSGKADDARQDDAISRYLDLVE